MRGHQQILELRRKGYAPEFIRVDDWDHESTDDLHTISLQRKDLPEAIDWRFTVGRLVLVGGNDPKRVQRLYGACSKYAKRVIATTFAIREGVKDWRGHQQFEVVRIDDTDGVMKWQA